MLVLARRVNERLVIDGEIVITVLSVGKNGQVRLGIEAPRHHQVYRHDVLVQIQAENRDALSTAGESAALHSLLNKLGKNTVKSGGNDETGRRAARET
jgi:carbon storage regulator